MNKEEFIIKAREIHGDKYNYDKVEYVNKSTKVCIICHEHGEFWQTPKAHIIQGYGCKKCGRKICAEKTKKTTEKFIEEAKEIHGDKYDYSKVEYTNAFEKVCIICPEHGEFWQTPHDHLKGVGCPSCGNSLKGQTKKLTQDEFIKRAREIHGDKYDYSKVKYINSNTNVCIICPEHGEFWQRPTMHINEKQGCQLCGYKTISEKKKTDLDSLIEKFNIVHGNKYNYSKVEYINTSVPITITCPIHGDFSQTPHSHLLGHGCPKCGVRLSKAENEIYKYCQSLFSDEIIQGDRSVINPFELDIYIPKTKVGIEYHGLIWHSTKYRKDKNYHLKKLNTCKEKSIKLLQIFEDEYINHKDIVFNKIKHILGKCDNSPKIYGRKCDIRKIDKNIARDFLDKFHIQGFVPSTIYLGCYYNNELVGVMTFKQEKKNCDKWELTRFASDYNYICCGVGGKLFSYFVRNYSPTEIKSFADRRWTVDEENNIYIQLGFKFDSYTNPDYHYFKFEDGLIRQHKFGFRKQILHKKYGLPLTMTEKEMTEKLGYEKIYDCGLIKYVWKKD